MPPKSRKKGQNVLAIAFDFGTTFSALAYMPVTLNGLTMHLDIWPGSNGKANKVPTVIGYERDTNNHWQPKAFGFAVESIPTSHRCSMFKLRLDEGSESDDMNPAQVPKFDDFKKNAAVLIKDFIELVYQHMVERLSLDGFGPDNVNYDAHFTVPAQFNWSQVEKFKKIVKSTGFGKHTVNASLREPEAAILYTINNVHREPSPEEGDGIILCDSGGGTIDIASYRVTEIEPRVEIEQLNIVSGSRHGSIYIDGAFQRWLYEECIDPKWKDIFNSSPDARKHVHRMCKSFVVQKEYFENKPSTPVFHIEISPRDLTGPHIEDGIIKITREKMCEFFEYSVNGTIECLQDHLLECLDAKQPIKFIYLVGGLGSSIYLQDRIQQYISSVGCSNIEVVRPPSAEYAVVKGGVEAHQASLLGFEEQITSRICPANYGIKISLPWDNKIHDVALDIQYTDPDTKVVLAKDQVVWLIRKGEKIVGKRRAEIREELSRHFRKRPQSVWLDTIVFCPLDTPPYRMTRDVKVVCYLESNMTGLPMTAYEKMKSKKKHFWGMRKNFYHADFDIVLKVGITDLDFSLVFNERVRSELLKIILDDGEENGDLRPRTNHYEANQPVSESAFRSGPT